MVLHTIEMVVVHLLVSEDTTELNQVCKKICKLISYVIGNLRMKFIVRGRC